MTIPRDPPSLVDRPELLPRRPLFSPRSPPVKGGGVWLDFEAGPGWRLWLGSSRSAEGFPLRFTYIICFPVIHCARFCEPLGVGTVSPWTETMSLGCVVDTLGDAFSVAIQILRCAAGRRCPENVRASAAGREWLVLN